MQKDQLKALHTPLGTHINLDGQIYRYFGGTAYLGIPQNEDFLKLYLAGLQQYGLNNGTSRGNNVQLGIYNEVENYAAKQFGAVAALITSSGYLAAQLALKAVLAMGEVRYAPATHPALWLNKAPVTQSDFGTWKNAVLQEINASTQQNWVIISNSMNNLYPEIYDFSFLKEVKPDKQIVLLVDDSHGIGINNNGKNALSAMPAQNNITVIVVASMAKALGVDAGIIFSSQKIITKLKNSNEFLGASPPAAAGLYAFMHGAEIYKVEREKLMQNITLLSEQLTQTTNWHFIKDFPVFFSKNADLSAKLFKQRILVSSFPYPNQNGPIVNRIVLTSRHSKADIEYLVQSLS